MDILLAEIERKKKQIDQNEVTSNKKYFKRSDLAAKQAEDYRKKQEDKRKEKEEKYGKRESDEDPVAAAIKKKKGDDGKTVIIPREEVIDDNLPVCVNLQSMEETTPDSDSVTAANPLVSHCTEEECTRNFQPTCNFVHGDTDFSGLVPEREVQYQASREPKHHELAAVNEVNLSITRGFERLERMVLYLSGKMDYKINELDEKLDRLYSLMVSKEPPSKLSGHVHTATSVKPHQQQQQPAHSNGSLSSLELRQKHQQSHSNGSLSTQPSLELHTEYQHPHLNGLLSTQPSLELGQRHQQPCPNWSFLTQPSLELQQEHQQQVASVSHELQQKHQQPCVLTTQPSHELRQEHQEQGSFEQSSQVALVSHDLQRIHHQQSLNGALSIPEATKHETNLRAKTLCTEQTPAGHCVMISQATGVPRTALVSLKSENIAVGGFPGVVLNIYDYEEAMKSKHASKCAIALAQMLFGVETLRMSTITGFDKKPKLDERIIRAIKVEVLQKYASCKPFDEQDRMWKHCLSSIASKCKDLRYQRDRKKKNNFS